jgi:hypothetical protein
MEQFIHNVQGEPKLYLDLFNKVSLFFNHKKREIPCKDEKDVLYIVGQSLDSLT